MAYYPSWETLPHERLSPRSDTVGRRLAVLRRLRHPGTDAATGPLQVVVTPVRSVLQPQVKGLGDLHPGRAGRRADGPPRRRRPSGSRTRRTPGSTWWRSAGEFAVRGGIVDVFPPTEEHPLRVELWGDDVEEIRSFAVADQRTLEPVDRLWAPPCRELLLTEEVRRRAAALGRAHPQLLELTDKIAAGIAVEGMESLAPVAGRRDGAARSTCCPRDTHVLVLDPERVRTRAHDLVATSEEFLGASWAAAAGGGQAPIDLGAASYRSLGDVREPHLGAGHAVVDDEPVRHRRRRAAGRARSDARRRAGPGARGSRPAEEYRGDIERAVGDVRRWLADGLPGRRRPARSRPRRAHRGGARPSTTCPRGSARRAADAGTGSSTVHDRCAAPTASSTPTSGSRC